MLPPDFFYAYVFLSACSVRSTHLSHVFLFVVDVFNISKQERRLLICRCPRDDINLKCRQAVGRNNTQNVDPFCLYETCPAAGPVERRCMQQITLSAKLQQLGPNNMEAARKHNQCFKALRPVRGVACWGHQLVYCSTFKITSLTCTAHPLM